MKLLPALILFLLTGAAAADTISVATPDVDAADDTVVAADSAGDTAAVVEPESAPAEGSIVEETAAVDTIDDSAPADTAVAREEPGPAPAAADRTAAPSPVLSEDKPDGIDKAGPPPRLTSAQAAKLSPFIRKKRKALYASSALMAAAVLLDYGLVVPRERGLEADDIEDSFALLNPQLLVFGLRAAAPPMACMRTSDVADRYTRLTGAEAPKNWSWYLYYGGWGLYVASGVVPYLDMMFDSNANWRNVGFGINIGADLVWAATIAYAYKYLHDLDNYRADGVPAQPRVYLAPSHTRSGSPGASLVLHF